MSAPAAIETAIEPKHRSQTGNASTSKAGVRGKKTLAEKQRLIRLRRAHRVALLTEIRGAAMPRGLVYIAENLPTPARTDLNNARSRSDRPFYVVERIRPGVSVVRGYRAVGNGLLLVPIAPLLRRQIEALAGQEWALMAEMPRKGLVKPKEEAPRKRKPAVPRTAVVKAQARSLPKSDVLTFENGNPRALTAQERAQYGMDDEFDLG